MTMSTGYEEFGLEVKRIKLAGSYRALKNMNEKMAGKLKNVLVKFAYSAVLYSSR